MNVKISPEPSSPVKLPSGAVTGQASMLGILKNYRDFRFLSFGTVGSHASQWILNITLAWLVLDLTNSALYVGLLGFAAGVPMVLVSVPSGVILDRANRRSVLLLCQLGMLVVAVALLALVLTGLATAWGLLAGMFCFGALMSLNNAGRQTIVPATVPRPAMPVAFGLTSAATHVSRIVGPSIAGLLIGASGVSAALIFNVVILISAFVATWLLSPGAGSRAGYTPKPGRYLDGFSYVRSNKLVRDLTLLAAIPMFFAFPYLQLLPVIARDILRVGPDGLGFMLAMSGVGAIAGGLLTGRAARIGPLGLFVLLATIAYGGIVLVIAFSTSIWLTIPAIVTGSVTGATFQTLNNTLFQLELDDDVRGRVTGVYMLGFGGYALGGLPLGYLADVYGAPFGIAAGGIVSSMLAAVLLILSPQLRALRKPAD